MKRFVLFLLVGIFTGIFLMFGFLAIVNKYNKKADVPPVTKTKSQSPDRVISTPSPTGVVGSSIKELTSDSSPSGKQIFGIGQLCGGIGKIPCPPNLDCQKEENNVDSSGFCQIP